MKRIQLSSRTLEDWGGKFVDQSNYDVLLEESAMVFKPDGTLLLALFKGAHSVEAFATAWSALKGFNLKSDNRGLASGTERVHRIKKDGTIDNRGRAELVTSGLAGYFERTPRFPYCRPCSFNLNDNAAFRKLFPLCQEASQFYAESGGLKYEKQKKHADKTHPEFMIPGTVFSTLTINKNFRTACHKDAGNLSGTLNVMTLFREGKFTGGNIVFPDFRVAAKLENRDCVVFDAHEFHGNTAILPISKKYTRCTVVYYYRENMDQCGSAQEELDRVKHRKLGEPLFEDDGDDE